MRVRSWTAPDWRTCFAVVACASEFITGLVWVGQRRFSDAIVAFGGAVGWLLVADTYAKENRRR